MLAGLGCVFAGLCYAEFASMIPIAGSAYTYGYATLGEFIAWIIGWDLILEYLFAASTVAVGWSGYFTEFMGQIGIHIPRQFTSAPFGVEGTHTLVRVGAVRRSGDQRADYRRHVRPDEVSAVPWRPEHSRDGAGRDPDGAARRRHSGVRALQQRRRLRQDRDRHPRDRRSASCT